MVRCRGQPGLGGGGAQPQPHARVSAGAARDAGRRRRSSTAGRRPFHRRDPGARPGWPTAPIAAARAALLACGELRARRPLVAAAARTNRWTIPTPGRSIPSLSWPLRPRPAPGPGARPLIAAARPPQPAPRISSARVRVRRQSGRRIGRADLGDPGQNRTVSRLKGPGLSGVSAQNPGQDRTVSAAKGPGLSGVSALNPGQDRTVSQETPPQTPPETPPPNARAGREPQNPRIRKDPPNPPEGGSRELGLDRRGATSPPADVARRRAVRVDLDEVRRELRTPGVDDRSDWEQIRQRLRDRVGAQRFRDLARTRWS